MTSKKPVLRNQQLDNLVMEFYNADSRSKMKLTVDELKLVNRPSTFVKSGFLDEKLIVASKLGKKVFIVIINEDSEFTDKEFGLMFRQSFLTKEKNLAIAEIATEKGLVVVGDESVSRYLTKADMFLSSSMYEILKTMKKIRSKGGYHARATRELKDMEEKQELLSHTLKSMLFTYKMENYMKAFGVHKKVQFASLCVLYLEAIPLSIRNIGEKVRKYLGSNDADPIGAMKILSRLGYVEQTKLGYSAAGGKQYNFPAKGWLLSSSGRDLVVSVMNKMINDMAQ